MSVGESTGTATDTPGSWSKPPRGPPQLSPRMSSVPGDETRGGRVPQIVRSEAGAHEALGPVQPCPAVQCPAGPSGHLELPALAGGGRGPRRSPRRHRDYPSTAAASEDPRHLPSTPAGISGLLEHCSCAWPKHGRWYHRQPEQTVLIVCL